MPKSRQSCQKSCHKFVKKNCQKLSVNFLSKSCQTIVKFFGKGSGEEDEYEEEDWWLQDQVATSSHLVKIVVVLTQFPTLYAC
jgi:hypothetical protein